MATNAAGYFWIDALCIDQRNDYEKARQVGLMRDVYATAEKVIAWLGKPSPNTGEAIDFVVALHNQIQRLYQAGQPVTRHTLTQAPCEHTATGWAALSRFLENPFFQRAWIIQEMVLSKYTDLVYGNQMIRWAALAEVIAIIEGNGLTQLLSIYQDSEPIYQRHGIRGILSCYAIRHLCNSGQPPTMLWCLFDCWRYQAKDPRDKIFALLGMAVDAGDPEFHPRYGNHPPQDIFKDTTRHLLTRDGSSAYVLHGAGIGLPRDLPYLPSWVPDWSSPFANTVFGAVASTAKFRASGNIDTANVCYGEGSSSITVRGRIIDTVSALADVKPTPVWHTGMTELKQKAQKDLAWIEGVCELLKSDHPYATSEAFFPTVVSRTLIANMIPLGIPAPQTFLDSFHDWVAQCRRLIAADPLSWEIGIPGSTVDSVYSASQYVTAHSMAVGSRRVFLTHHSFLGLGPPGIQQRDEVCILLGLATPFIIRKREEGGYYLVGECYLDGLMNGEGLSKGGEQDIVLY